MLSTAKKTKMIKALKAYKKKYLNSKKLELDESGTRLMVNAFLCEVLGFEPISEVKTEYMIRGTYADYVIQTKKNRHFLVEVKALSFDLSPKHLRQTVNYGANEGIEWALLTNGRFYDLYKIIFNKPIESRKVFSIDLFDQSAFKRYVDTFQFIHRDSIQENGLAKLWAKASALDPLSISGLLHAPLIYNYLKRTLKKKFNSKFTDEEMKQCINRVVSETIDISNVQVRRFQKSKRKKKVSQPTPSI